MRSNRFKRIILFWLTSTFIVEALPVEETSKNSSVAQTYRVTRWTSEDGLPANRITALAQTRNGYLWAGTWFGLVRFDGIRFVVFNRYNTPAMVNDAISALAVDREGDLWIGTSDGLLSLREGRFVRYTKEDGLPGRKVWRLVPSQAGDVWINTDNSVGLWRDGRLITAMDVHASKTNLLRSLWENDNGSLSVMMDSGIKRMSKNGEFAVDPSPAGAAWRGPIHGGLIDRHKDYWLSTEAGVFRSNAEDWQRVQQVRASEDIAHVLYEDRNGSVWVSRGSGGLWRCAENKAEVINLNERAQNPSVECIIEDREGQLWFGSDNGLYQLRPKLVRAYSSVDGLPNNECWSVCEGPDGAIWLETRAGVARIQDGKVERIEGEPERRNRMSILIDNSGAMWMGNGDNGVCSWRPGAETNWFWQSVKPSVTLDSLYLDRRGRVWVGCNKGVTWIEDGRPAANWGDFGLPTNSIPSIYQTQDGTMWFGTWQAGAVRWRYQARNGVSEDNHHPSAPVSTRFTTADGLADNRVFVFHEDSDGVLWIGTHNGLSRFKQGGFFTFRTEHGLLDNLINWLEEDDFGRFWFSCNRGIFRIDRNELNEVADGKRIRANSAIYGTADGMLSPETNGEHQPAGCKTRQGRIWFPTIRGIVVIDPHAMKDNDVPPPVVIEAVRADRELVQNNWPQPALTNGENRDAVLKLAPGRARTLQFRYTANSFADPRRVRFRYRLAGRDTEWSEETEERVAYYTDLRPGSYQFEVMAANPHGIWTETPARFSFTLRPKFTQTAWFPVLCAIGLLGASGGLGIWHLRWQRRVFVAEQNAKLERERARIARDLHDDLGTALTGLALELDVIRRDAQKIPSSSNRLTATAQHTRQLAERMREVVWAVNPRCDTVSSVASFLEQQTAQFLQSDGIRGRLDFPDEIPDLHMDSETRHQLILAVREALTNIVRHAASTQVVLRMTFEERMLVLQVADNGCGFNSNPEIGHGLHNIGQRLERIGARFSYESASGKGTTLTFRIPLEMPTESDEKAKL